MDACYPLLRPGNFMPADYSARLLSLIEVSIEALNSGVLNLGLVTPLNTKLNKSNNSIINTDNFKNHTPEKVKLHKIIESR